MRKDLSRKDKTKKLHLMNWGNFLSRKIIKGIGFVQSRSKKSSNVGEMMVEVVF